MKKKSTASNTRPIKIDSDRLDRIAMQPMLLGLRDQVATARINEKMMRRFFSSKSNVSTHVVHIKIAWRDLDAVLKLLKV